MDTSAGIGLRPTAAMLCVLNGGDPKVIARCKGFGGTVPRAGAPSRAPVRHSELSDWFKRVTDFRRPKHVQPSFFDFERVGDLLQNLKNASAPTDPRRVAIAVPAWANDVQRRAVAEGAKAAGWEVLGLLNEATAAALASGVLRDGDGTALVFDLTENRFDVTIVTFRGLKSETLAADGLDSSPVKESLGKLLLQTKIPCRRAMKYAGLDQGAIDAVVLVGDSARNPETVAFVTEFFGQPPLSRFDPELVVGFGAAAHASILDKR